MSHPERAPVQRDCTLGTRPGGCGQSGPNHRCESGTIAWAEHEEAWADYAKRFSGQSAERMAERGGFSFWELCDHLGHPPTTWETRA